MSETKGVTVYGVRIGQEGGQWSVLFQTREAAQRYCDARNEVQRARWEEHVAWLVAKYEAIGNARRAARARDKVWEPWYFVAEMPVYATAEVAP